MTFLLIALLLILGPKSFGQPRLFGFLGVNYPVYTDDHGIIHRYWKPGFVVGGRTELQLINHLELVPTLSYQYLRFSGYTPGGYSSDRNFISSSGSGSHVVQIGTDVILHESDDQPIDAQLIVGVGYQWMNFGTITVDWQTLEGYSQQSSSHESRNTWYVAYGFGFDIRLSSRVFVSTSLRSNISIDYRNSGSRGDVIYSDASITDWLVSAVCYYQIF